MEILVKYWPMIAFSLVMASATVAWLIRLEVKLKGLADKTDVVSKYGEKLEEIGKTLVAIQTDFSWLKKLNTPTK